jgi:LacI family transcriptional regulator
METGVEQVKPPPQVGQVCTQSDLARAAGVTRLTVRRALSGGKGVGEATRKRVIRLARQLGYRPNAAARAMAERRFNAIAIIKITGTPAGLSGGIHHGIEMEANKLDFHVMTGYVSREDLISQRSLPRILREWLVDGLLVGFAADIPPKMQEVVRQFRIPTMWMNVKLLEDCIYPDDYAAARDAAARLIGLGHRRILYLGPDEGAHYSIPDRARGYADVMREAGLAPRRLGEGPSQAHEPIASVLREPERPTAVLAGTYSPIVPVIAALSAGLRIPEDVSVMGLVDPSVPPVMGDVGAVLMGKTVSAMRLPVYAIGHMAVRRLVEKIADPAVSFPATALPFEAEPGETCAPPPDTR